VPRSSTLHCLGAAVACQTTHLVPPPHSVHGLMTVPPPEGSFLVGRHLSICSPLAEAFQATVGEHGPRGMRINAWLRGSCCIKILCDLSQWVRGPHMMVLPDDTLWTSHMLCGTCLLVTLFPQMCTAFEVFLLTLLPLQRWSGSVGWNRPVGPPIPPDHGHHGLYHGG